MYKFFPLINVFILMITAFIIPIVRKKKIAKEISIFSNAVILILSILILVNVINIGGFHYKAGYPNTFFGIDWYIGSIESILSVLFAFVSLLILMYSYKSIEHEVPNEKIDFYYILLNLLLASLLGIIYTNDLFNSYVFIEVSTLAACGIIVIKDKKANIKATIKYLIMSTVGSGLILMAIAYIYSITGHLNMSLIHEVIIRNYSQYPNSILIILVLFTVGLGVKSAMFPLHGWLPDAHSSAPTPSSAVLSGLVIKVYAFTLIKILYRVFSFSIVNETIVLDVIILLGSCGMIFGSIMAIMQKELKRMIAYSSIAQMGYVFFGIGLGTPAGVATAVFHIVGHAVTKSALFLCSGLMIEKVGSKKIADLKGIGREMPLALILFTLGAFSMIGIPILPGFISKWYLSLACIEINRLSLVIIILTSSILNVIYYFPIIINGFFGHENLEGKVYKSKSVSFDRMLPIILLMTSMILVGGFSKNILSFISTAF